jgi:hypothetical protein
MSRLSLGIAAAAVFLSAVTVPRFAHADEISITPGRIILAPLGKQQFVATGGSGGYHWTIWGNSGGTIDPDSGAYVAGKAGQERDVIGVTDSAGSSALAFVDVTWALTDFGSSGPMTVPPRASRTFHAYEGSGGYVYSLLVNGSGATVDAVTGKYVAGPQGSVADVVQVTDSNGATLTWTVNVGPNLEIVSATSAVPLRGSLQLSATGGNGVYSYVWAIAEEGSGGASIDRYHGNYWAGGTPNSVDTVQVVDDLGNRAIFHISVGGAPTINPGAPSVPPQGFLVLTATGTAAWPHWTLTTNSSGGLVDEISGTYFAGKTGGVTDVVTMTDGAGNEASVRISVGPALTVTPDRVELTAGARQPFAVGGGSGKGYHWTIVRNQSGGAMELDGIYRAGRVTGTDQLEVVDSLGNAADVVISVAGEVAAPPGQGCDMGGSAGAGALPGVSLALFALVVLRRRRRA